MTLQEKVKRILDDITERLPDLFPMMELEERTADERSPYTSVFLQECERMNMLLFELKRSLAELDLGLKGDLSISQPMEAVMNALYDDKVPATWNARAFLTAVMQVTARKNELPLDRLATVVDVTKKMG